MPNQIDKGRRSLFRGRLSPATQLLPPWAVTEAAFYDLCTRCGDCASACPESVIVNGSGGFPTMDFSRGECTFCTECTTHCPSGALAYNANQNPWFQTATISSQCLAHNKVVCRSCGEACEPEAITYPIQDQGIGIPNIDHLACNGCGACVSICPSKAIAIELYPSTKNSGVNLDESANAVC